MISYKEMSIQIIKQNQYPTGAYLYPASESRFRLSWFLSGSFIAYAMDQVGESESAESFYNWCRFVIEKYESKARTLIFKMQSGERVEENQLLHGVYTVDGEESESNHQFHQLGGFGSWLWGLSQHLKLSGQKEHFIHFQKAVEITIDYLAVCWKLLIYGCLDKEPDKVYFATLSAIYGGLQSIAFYLPSRADEISQICSQIRQSVMKNGANQGYIVTKLLGSSDMDVSLLWLGIPFKMISMDDPIFVEIINKIQQEFLDDNGIYRYQKNAHYKIEQRIILLAWLGWYFAWNGEKEKAWKFLQRIESLFTTQGFPQQVGAHFHFSKDSNRWIERKGELSCPFLWSYAMYLVLSEGCHK